MTTLSALIRRIRLARAGFFPASPLALDDIGAFRRKPKGGDTDPIEDLWNGVLA